MILNPNDRIWDIFNRRNTKIDVFLQKNVFLYFYDSINQSR